MRTLERDGVNSFVASGSHANGAAFEPIYMFPSLEHVRIVVVAGAGTAVVEYTISSIADVKADTAVWFTEKSCTGTVSHLVTYPLTALRITGNAATYQILAT